MVKRLGKVKSVVKDEKRPDCGCGGRPQAHLFSEEFPAQKIDKIERQGAEQDIQNPYRGQTAAQRVDKSGQQRKKRRPERLEKFTVIQTEAVQEIDGHGVVKRLVAEIKIRPEGEHENQPQDKTETEYYPKIFSSLIHKRFTFMDFVSS